MSRVSWIFALAALSALVGCAQLRAIADWRPATDWRAAVDKQVADLGHRNWIVIAESSFPAHSRQGLRQVQAPVEVPEALDYVLQSLERSESLRPQIFVSRELRSVENDYAPGMDEFRAKLKDAMHGHEPTELDQASLVTLVEDANRSYQVLVVRTQSTLPYSSVFLELKPGYWDVDADDYLHESIEKERMQRLVQPRL